MPRYQIGSLRKIMRAEGLTWVLRYYATRSDGKRVERTTAIGLVKDIGPSPADASREVDRQKLRETINQLQPFQGTPRTFGQLCQDYIENELRIDQSESARPKAFPTVETYERHLIKRIIPRWGRLGTFGRGIEGCRGMVSRTAQGKCSEEGETVSRSYDRQNPPHHEPGLQARAAMQLPASPAGRQSHELGEPTNDERLPGDSHDAEAGVRGSSQYSRAKAHVDSKRRGHCSASIRTVGLDVDGSRFRGDW